MSLGQRIESRLPRPEPKATGAYYWIWAIKNGRLVVVGSEPSEQEAYRFGYSKLGDVEFHVVALPTRNMDTAVRMIKAKVLDRTANLDFSIKRARRKV